jgi:predicted Zn finger-like uncharacterized protein
VIVTCERCGTQFQLDDARVPKRGVRVRCSRCKNAFRVVPEARRAAEEIAELARRAREDSQEEITQDLAEDSPGDSRSRAAGGRGGRRAEEPRSDAPPSQASASSDLLDEESDWKFNEDVSGEVGERARSGGESTKPDPPPARSGARNADDWFSGGGDAPLELDDRRPWDASAAEEPEAPAGSAPAEPAPPAPPAPAASAASPEETEPVPEPLVAPELPDRARPAAEVAPSDELSDASWDLFAGAEAGEAEASEAEAAESDAGEREPARARASRGAIPALAATASYLGRWLGYGATALGWLLTLGVFGAGLYAGLATRTTAAPGPDRVAGLEIHALEGRFVENAVSGALFVVSGRVRNPGPEAGVLPGLELELLDAAGAPLGGDRVPLHAPISTAHLRESPASLLSQQELPQAPLQPGEERPFEVVLSALPREAAAFRIVESPRHRAATGPLPEVELPH